MPQRSIQIGCLIRSPRPLRSSLEFIEQARAFESEIHIYVEPSNRRFDGKSIIDLMLAVAELYLVKQDNAVLEAVGCNAEQALDSLEKLSRYFVLAWS